MAGNTTTEAIAETSPEEVVIRILGTTVFALGLLLTISALVM